MTESHLFPNKVNVELNMLGAAMMNRIGGEVDGGDVVTIHHGGLVDRTRELLKKLSKPRTLGDRVCYNTILSLGTGAGDRGLPLGRP